MAPHSFTSSLAATLLSLSSLHITTAQQVPQQNGGYQNGGYQNNGYQNGGYQNGGYQNGGYQGYGTSTRYWDCCMPSCSNPNKAPVTHPVNVCSVQDQPLFSQGSPLNQDPQSNQYQPYNQNQKSNQYQQQSNQYQQPDQGVQSGCGGGNGFQCSDQSPRAINQNLAIGFAAANIAGLTESDWCCACYACVFSLSLFLPPSPISLRSNANGE